jgi:hypothetical protein
VWNSRAFDLLRDTHASGLARCPASLFGSNTRVLTIRDFGQSEIVDCCAVGVRAGCRLLQSR